MSFIGSVYACRTVRTGGRFQLAIAHRTVRENVLKRLVLVSATTRTATVAGRSGSARRTVNETGCSGITLAPLQPGLVTVLRAIRAAVATPPWAPGMRHATAVAPSSAADWKRIVCRVRST